MPPMQWLMALCPPEVAADLLRHGHRIHDLAEAGLAPDASPGQILQAANTRQWDVITADSALAQAPFAGDQAFGRSIVYLHNGGTVDRLFERFPRLSTRRLYTVAGRVKVRQLPGRQNPP
jgi:hypothetical protein